MLALFAALVALGCVAASARRLELAMETSTLDPTLVLEALRGADSASLQTLRSAALAREDLPWERAVLDGLAEADPAARDAALEEQLLERDWRAQRWARVPRVCASIATSGGFLFASIALMQGLAAPPGEAPAVGAALLSAVNSLLVGIAGTVFCVSVHVRTRRVVRERVAGTDRLVARLRSLAAEPADAPGRAGGGGAPPDKT
jgi:hypothetical protein